MSVTQTGDKELIRYFNTLPKKLIKKDLRVATRNAAKRIALPEARRGVPDGPDATGKAERSLTVRVAKGNKGGRLPRHIVGHSVTTRESLFTGEDFYVGFLEFGTAERQTKSGANRGSVQEYKFLRDSINNNTIRISQSVRKDLIAGLNETARQSGMPRI